MIVEHVCLSGQGGKILNCARRDTGRTREGDPQRVKCVVRVKCRCCSFLLLLGESAPLYLLLSLFHVALIYRFCMNTVPNVNFVLTHVQARSNLC